MPNDAHMTPTFTSPPLNEMVLGVQFSSPSSYSVIYAGGVRDLFRADYPLVQEQPPLAPQFGTFGVSFQPPQLMFSFGSQQAHQRFWFVSQDTHQLLQYQHDRLLHNWRQVDGRPDVPYPGFEVLAARFSDELSALAGYLETLGPDKFTATQAELTYINRIFGPDQTQLPKADEYLRFLNFRGVDIPAEIFAGAFNHVVKNDSGDPIARMIVEVNTAFDANRQRPMMMLTITYRGAPLDKSVQGTLDFLRRGHQLTVDTFEKITTPEAQRKWGRQ